MQKLLERSGAAAVALGLLLMGAAPALAAHRHHGAYHRHHDRAYVDAHRNGGAYAWAPRGYAVHGWYNSGDVNERLCMLSPASVDYQPCMNRR